MSSPSGNTCVLRTYGNVYPTLQEHIAMKPRTPSGATDARPVRAFQTDPSWYEDYWYGAEPPMTPRPARRHLAARTLLAAAIGWLHRLIAEQSAEHTPVAKPQDAL